MSLTHKTLASSFIVLATKFIQRGLGLVSMLILARILTPEDFGIVSISTMAVFLFITFTDLGAKQYISKIKEASTEAINSAWSLNILIKFSIWGLFLLGVDAIVLFLEKPEVRDPLYVLSIILPLSCTGNPGVWLFSRNLNYKPLFKIEIASKLIAFAFVLIHVWIYESYWAMIYGTILTYALPMLLSYTITDHKPRFTLSNVKDQFTFSQWIILKGFLGYAKSQADAILVSKYFALDLVGVYGMFKNLSAMPNNQLVQPLTEPLLATFSISIREDRLSSYQVNLAVFASMLFIAPMTALMLFYHYEIVYLFLGAKWTEYSIVFANLSLMLIPLVLSRNLSQLLIAMDHINKLFYYDLVSSICVIVATVIGIQYFTDLASFSLYVAGLKFINVFIFVVFVSVFLFRIKLIDLVFYISPIVFTLPPMFILMQINMVSLGSIVELFAGSALFCALYALQYIAFSRLMSGHEEIQALNRLFSSTFKTIKFKIVSIKS
ncbi:oligosaccharide flippase family protein [Ningiella sp. W23]|uniref:oligosaccharide flippase family protein n=1 Tax=Ningiella sp. W23 TaxID=3023715 RepID=UPI003757753B